MPLSTTYYHQSIKKQDSESSSNNTTVQSATERVIQKFKQKFIVFHYSPFKAVWDWVVLLLVVFLIILDSFIFSFDKLQSSKVVA